MIIKTSLGVRRIYQNILGWTGQLFNKSTFTPFRRSFHLFCDLFIFSYLPKKSENDLRLVIRDGDSLLNLPKGPVYLHDFLLKIITALRFLVGNGAATFVQHPRRWFSLNLKSAHSRPRL